VVFEVERIEMKKNEKVEWENAIKTGIERCYI
jgi:hypothetical protein